MKELESFSAIWMEDLLIQSSTFLIMKSVDMRNIQALALKESTPGGQSLPKSSITMLLPEKSALLSLKANVKLKSMLFYDLNLWSKFWTDPGFEIGFCTLVCTCGNQLECQFISIDQLWLHWHKIGSSFDIKMFISMIDSSTIFLFQSLGLWCLRWICWCCCPRLWIRWGSQRYHFSSGRRILLQIWRNGLRWRGNA